MLARPARIALSSQPCSARPASYFCSRWYSWRARLFSAMVPPAFPLSFALFFFFAIAPIVEPDHAQNPAKRARRALRRQDVRSEERRVGKEWRSRREADQYST